MEKAGAALRKSRGDKDKLRLEKSRDKLMAVMKKFSTAEIRREEIEYDAESDVLGTGSFGIVYKGTCRGCPVAIKRPKPSVFHGVTASQINAFKDEVRILSTISHPHIALFMGAYVSVPPDGGDVDIMIVTELLRGGDLKQVLLDKVRPLSLFQRLKWARQAAEGLSWLHGSGVVHLDMKPGNLLLDSRSLSVKVCDFGLSRVLPVGKHFRSGNKAIGTPVYTAPELLLGQKFNHTCDVYSFGITLWCIITRKRPSLHSATYPDKETFLRAVCFENVRPKLECNDASYMCPAALKQLVEWCWDTKAEKRPGILEVVEKLRPILVQCAIPDEVGATLWAENFQSGADLVEWVEWEAMFAALMERLKLKKSKQSTSAGVLELLLASKPTASAASRMFDLHPDKSYVNICHFGRILGLLGPLDKEWLKRVKRLAHFPWFFGEMSGGQSEKLLARAGRGAFIVRFSSAGSNFTLSYVKGKKIWHTRILHDYGSNRYQLDGMEQAFASLETLVASALKSKYEKIAAPCPGSPYKALFSKKVNTVGGYTSEYIDK